MAFAKGTALPVKTQRRTNPAKVGNVSGSFHPNPNLTTKLGVARKPAKNKAAK